MSTKLQKKIAEPGEVLAAAQVAEVVLMGVGLALETDGVVGFAAVAQAH